MWDLRKLAAATMDDDQRGNFGRYETLTGHCSGVSGHLLMGDKLYTSAVDNGIRLWDLGSLVVKIKIVGHSDFVRALTSVGERLISGSDDRSIRIWDTDFHDCVKVRHWSSGLTAGLVSLTVSHAFPRPPRCTHLRSPFLSVSPPV